MQTKHISFMLLLLAATMLTGCQTTQSKDKVTRLEGENLDLRAQLDDRNAALESANYELREKDMSIAQLKRDLDSVETVQAVAADTTTFDPTASSGSGFDDIPGVSGTVGAGEVTATVASDVLFASGKTSLRNAAKRSLDEVARVIQNSYAGMPIRVTGHTDTDPIKKSGFKSNYHLGFERAYAVRDYLLSRGVPARNLHVATFGPDRPAGSKEQSRRVEITVILN